MSISAATIAKIKPPKASQSGYDFGNEDFFRKLVMTLFKDFSTQINLAGSNLTFTNEFTLTALGGGVTQVALATTQPNVHTWSANQTLNAATGIDMTPSGSFGLQVNSEVFQKGTMVARFEGDGSDAGGACPIFTNATVGVEIQGFLPAFSTAVIRSFNRTSSSGGSYDKLAIQGAPLDICPNFSGFGATIVSGGAADSGSSGQLFRILTATFIKSTVSMVPTQSVAGDATAIELTSANAGKFVNATQNSTTTAPWITLQSGTFTGGTSTTFMDLKQTWNTTGVLTGIRLQITNIAAGTGSKFIECFGGGSGSTSLFSVDLFGNLVSASSSINGTSVLNTQFTVNEAAGNVGIAIVQPTSVNAAGISVSGGSLTGSHQDAILDLAQTWNVSAGNAPTAIKVNITDSASDGNSKLLDLQVGGNTRFKVEKGGNFIITPNVSIAMKVISSGGSGASSVFASGALNTTATDGFIYIPTCAGAPTGTPTTQTGTVAVVYDTTNNQIYVYNGAWKKTAVLT